MKTCRFNYIHQWKHKSDSNFLSTRDIVYWKIKFSRENKYEHCYEIWIIERGIVLSSTGYVVSRSGSMLTIDTWLLYSKLATCADLGGGGVRGVQNSLNYIIKIPKNMPRTLPGKLKYPSDPPPPGKFFGIRAWASHTIESSSEPTWFLAMYR